MRTLSIIAACILVSGLCLGASAREEGGGPGLPGMGGMRGGGRNMLGIMQGERGMEALGKYRGPNFYLRLRGELGIDDSQVQKIKAIRMDLVRQVSQVTARLAVGRAELRDMLDSDNVDLAKVQAKVAEIAGLRSDRIFAGIKAHVEATRALTDEQRKKALERPRMGHGEGRMRPGGGRRMWGADRLGPGAGLLPDDETEQEEN